jgi:cell division protein FtsB
MAADRKAIVRRLAAIVILGAALLFAVQGGEFSTRDLVQQRRTKAQVTVSIDSLRRVVDSLRRYNDKLEHDPVTQERIAREVFGMVRGDKELLYRFTDAPDSVGHGPRDSAQKKR